MCDTCGCTITPGNQHLADAQSETVEVLQNLLHANDHQAEHNRAHFNGHGVLAVNLMSSPGAGKTRLLEQTIAHLGNDFRIAVIEGDLETENDAQRIRETGAQAVQINTGTACHLDAHLVHNALHGMNLDNIDIVFIENVGNLVCPASFDLGQHCNITLLSTTEGDDKPAKYPVMFKAAELVLITKTDLLPHLPDFTIERAANYVRQLANPAPVMPVSATSGAGLAQWFDWLQTTLTELRERAPQGIGAHRHDDHEHGHGHGHGHDHSHAHRHVTPPNHPHAPATA